MAKLPRDTITHYEHDGKGNINITITDLIRCKDCIYSGDPDENKWRLCHYDGGQWNEENHYCGYAERRSE